MRPRGVNVGRVACLLELGPLAHLLSFGFLRPADKCRLAAGHGELPEVMKPRDGGPHITGPEEASVRSVTLGENFYLEDHGSPFGGSSIPVQALVTCPLAASHFLLVPETANFPA